MAKINRHIEIVSSSITKLSSMSDVSRRAIQETLSKHYGQVGITLVDDLSDLEALVAKKPDLVLLGMKYVYDGSDATPGGASKIWLADYLNERDVATTGSQSIAHRLELNKPLAKKCVHYADIKTSPHYVAKAGTTLRPANLPSDYPMFVKPTNRGGGAGIDSDSVVYSLPELQSKVDSISSHLNSDSLIEKYLPGREFSVAVMKAENRNDYLAMLLELVAPSDENGVRILGSKVKSNDSEQAKEVTDRTIRQSITELAIGAFHAIGGRDYGRIDIRMDEHGVPHFLEANLIPSLINNYGSFPKACSLNIDLSYEQMLLHIVDLGMARAMPISSLLEPATEPSGGMFSKAYS